MEKTYLSINEQENVIMRFQMELENAPKDQKFYLTYGNGISYFTSLACSLVVWQSGYRAYYIYRYAKGRFLTLFISLLSPLNGMFLHHTNCNTQLKSYFRSETKWHYGVRSALSHSVGLLSVAGPSLLTTYLIAQRAGLTPICEPISKAGFKKSTYYYFISRLRPSAIPMAVTFATTTAIMFAVGILEFEDSCKILARMKRKSLCLKD